MNKLKLYWERCDDAARALLTRHGIEYPFCGFSIGLGWINIVEEAFIKLIAAGWDRKLGQVKQKFCGLRIYIDQSTYFPGSSFDKNEFGKIIEEAEDKCSRVCEECGKPHGLSIPRVGRALCSDCADAWGNK